MAKISKFFRVALEGASTDGRTIAREWITQMAKNFDPKKYGARVWLEHLRGLMPDGPFKAYGDVVALKAEEVEIDGVKKMALYAQVDPTDDLVKLSKARQKIYTSIEINQKFADTGEAYLVGLGITDSPASLGTEVLAFAAQNPDTSPFKGRKSSPDTLFSEAVENSLEFVEENEPEVKTLSSKVKDLLKKYTDKKSGDESRFADVTAAVETLLEHVCKLGDQFANAEQLAKADQRIAALEKKLEESDTAFTSLKEQLDKEENRQTARPTATGGKGEKQTDC